MNLVKQIPNLITLGNLLSGVIAILFAVEGNFTATALFVLLGIFLDFFDGFAARILKASGELGKQLDSLADMVTSGVVPGLVMFKLFEGNLEPKITSLTLDVAFLDIRFIGLLLTVGACWRLANFNIDERQSDSFIGLPTPAMAIFIVSLPLILEYSDFEEVSLWIENNYFLIGVTLVFTFLMNINLPLFSLKFKDFSITKNKVKYLFLILSLFLLIFLEIVAIPLIILLYLLISVIQNFKN